MITLPAIAGSLIGGRAGLAPAAIDLISVKFTHLSSISTGKPPYLATQLAQVVAAQVLQLL
jgi:hypothetical protein